MGFSLSTAFIHLRSASRPITGVDPACGLRSHCRLWGRLRRASSYQMAEELSRMLLRPLGLPRRRQLRFDTADCTLL